MSEGRPELYTLACSRRALQELERLVRVAAALGLGREAIDAVKQIRHVLQVYPQYGEKVQDFPALGLCQYRLSCWQFVIVYGVHEARRAVFVVAPPKPLPFGPLAPR